LEIEAIAGQLKWDGLVNITSGIETFGVGGAITTSAVSGTYTEENNCQGTAQTISGLGTRNFRTVVVNDGEDDNNTLVAGTAQE
jgi:hypothetical protein